MMFYSKNIKNFGLFLVEDFFISMVCNQFFWVFKYFSEGVKNFENILE